MGVFNCGGFSVLRCWPVSVGVFTMEGRDYGLMFGWIFDEFGLILVGLSYGVLDYGFDDLRKFIFGDFCE